MGDVVHHVEEIPGEEEGGGGSRVIRVLGHLVDDISLRQGVDERSIILGVPSNTNVNLSSPACEGSHEVEKRDLNETRVFSNCARSNVQKIFFGLTGRWIDSRIWFTTDISIEKP